MAHTHTLLLCFARPQAAVPRSDPGKRPSELAAVKGGTADPAGVHAPMHACSALAWLGLKPLGGTAWLACGPDTKVAAVWGEPGQPVPAAHLSLLGAGCRSWTARRCANGAGAAQRHAQALRRTRHHALCAIESVLAARPPAGAARSAAAAAAATLPAGARNAQLSPVLCSSRLQQHPRQASARATQRVARHAHLGPGGSCGAAATPTARQSLGVQGTGFKSRLSRLLPHNNSHQLSNASLQPKPAHSPRSVPWTSPSAEMRVLPLLLFLALAASRQATAATLYRVRAGSARGATAAAARAAARLDLAVGGWTCSESPIAPIAPPRPHPRLALNPAPSTQSQHHSRGRNALEAPAAPAPPRTGGAATGITHVHTSWSYDPQAVDCDTWSGSTYSSIPAQKWGEPLPGHRACRCGAEVPQALVADGPRPAHLDLPPPPAARPPAVVSGTPQPAPPADVQVGVRRRTGGARPQHSRRSPWPGLAAHLPPA